MIDDLYRLSGFFWSASHLVGIGVAVHLWRRERHGAYVWFGVSWLAMAVNGIAITQHTPFFRIVTICGRFIGSGSGLIALWTLARLARSRMVTIYTAKGGDVFAHAHHRLDLEHDTVRPPPPN